MMTPPPSIAADRQLHGSVIYIAPDVTDSAVQKRACGMIGAGVDLISFSFRRVRYNQDFVPDWPNIELGVTRELRLLRRWGSILRAVGTIFTHRRLWRSASVLYVRNLDLALLTLLGRLVTRSRGMLVYEVLDVHPATTRSGSRSALLRWLERRVLQRTDLLVISSPAFMRHYFGPKQGYQGRFFLMENKWPAQSMSGIRRKLAFSVTDPTPRWTIGWFGNIRCPKSLQILTNLADQFPDQIHIYIRGCISLMDEASFLEVVGQRENMTYEGEYVAPEDLVEIYSRIHFNWCVDLCGGDNSRWLLPNRVYEGGYFGVPAIAVADHETGRLVAQRRLGLVFSSLSASDLGESLCKLSKEQYVQLRSTIERHPKTEFVDEADLTGLIESIAACGHSKSALHGRRVPA